MVGEEKITNGINLNVFLVAAGALLALDLLLICMSVLVSVLRSAGLIETTSWRFSLVHDWSFGEIVTYVKWAAIVAAMADVWRRRRVRLFLALALVFAIVLADDMLQPHERGGDLLIAPSGPDRLGLSPKMQGELLVWSILGLAVLCLLLFGFRNSPRSSWPLGTAFVALLGGLVLCGGVLDVVASMIGPRLDDTAHYVVMGALKVAEDGGEMLLASLVCALALACWAAPEGAARPRPISAPADRTSAPSPNPRPARPGPPWRPR